MGQVLKLIVLALSLGLDTLSVSVGIGLQGISRRQTWRIGLSFTAYQVLLPIPGIFAGERLGRALGDIAAYLGFGGLIVLGLYLLYLSRKERSPQSLDLSSGWGLALASLTVSLDSFAVGFSLGLLGVPIGTALLFIGIAGFAMTFLGLRFGHVLGRSIKGIAEVAAGAVLSLTGIGLLVQKLFFE
jgi:putative Mn2+ efflux pump MntP